MDSIFLLKPVLFVHSILVNLNVIREMLQVQFQYTDYAQPAQTQLLVVTSNFEKTFGLVAADSGKHKCSI